MKFSFFPKCIDNSLTHQTNFGAFITLIVIIAALVLSISEIRSYCYPSFIEQLVANNDVRSSINETDISFEFIITLPCNLVHIDFFDPSPKRHTTNQLNLNKTRLDLNNKPLNISYKLPSCGDCYGSNTTVQCCNTCEDIIRNYQNLSWSISSMMNWSQCRNEQISINKEKCKLKGSFTVSTWLKGGFHIAPGINVFHRFIHFHDYSPLSNQLNLSHQINYLHFGDVSESPLDDTQFNQEDFKQVHYRYQLIAIPKVIYEQKGEIVKGFQFTVNFAEIPVEFESRFGAGIFFIYNFAPIGIVIKPEDSSLAVLFTRIVSIIGGTFLLGRLIDSFGYRLNTLEGKLRIGKGE